MTPLEKRLIETIAATGPITVGEYMAAVLGDPEHGYYRTRDPLGAAGDFTTAPEISQAFGELIGLWCAVTWQQMGEPKELNLVELGPGRGTLMADLLRAAKSVPEFSDAITVDLVETSPALRDLQRQTLTFDGAPAVRWREALKDVPSGPAIFIANEFFDALPVEQVVRTDGGWRTVRVGIDGESRRLRFLRCGEDAAPRDLPAALREAGPGSVCEFSPARDAVARALAKRIAGDGGAALIIDYGPARSAAGDSLQAVRRHRYYDPLATPGMADLTAHVDFESLARTARRAGVAVFGPIEQGTFLTRLGIGVRAARLVAAAADPDAARRIATGCQRLTDPAAMGALFKVLALTPAAARTPAGFEGGGGPSC